MPRRTIRTSGPYPMMLIGIGIGALAGCPNHPTRQSAAALAPGTNPNGVATDLAGHRSPARPPENKPFQSPPRPALPDPPQTCNTDKDCVVVILPRCSGPGGCSPPCGHVYHTRTMALSRQHSAEYTSQVSGLEKARCNFDCLACLGHPPPLPNLKDYSTHCQNSRCVLSGGNTQLIPNFNSTKGD